MNPTHTQRPWIALLVLSVCLLFLGGNGFVGGYLMISDPNGTPMGMPVSVLEQTLFQNFFIPGLCLIFIWGCGSLLTLAGLWLGPQKVGLDLLSPLFHEHWSWILSVVLGLGLMVWLTYQLITLPAIAPVQIVLLVLSVLLVGVPLMPAMRLYYRSGNAGEWAARS